MIQSKLNKIAWIHHFPIMSISDISKRSSETNSAVSGLIWPNSELIEEIMYVLITCKNEEDPITKNALE